MNRLTFRGKTMDASWEFIYIHHNLIRGTISDLTDKEDHHHE